MSGDVFRLTDRVIVLTGGAGQLGRAFTRSLREAGAWVAVLDPVDTAENGDEGVFSLACDVTSRSDLERALAAIEDRWETPHGLINAAALDSPPNSPAEENGPFETYPEASWDRVMDVNVKGVFLCCQVIGGAMAKAGRGSVINVGSIYGLVSPDQRLYQYRRDRGETFFKPVAYSASKSALYNLTRYLATYWGRVGVRVNCVTFGGVFNHQAPEFLEAYNAKVPMGRMAQTEEYNGPIQFLLSDASSYVTGANLVIDGGFTAW